MTGGCRPAVIAFVAPVNAELSGRAIVSARLLERLPADSVTLFDTSPSPRIFSSVIGSVLRRWRECCALARYVVFAARSGSSIQAAYISVNADPGVVMTMAFAAVSRLAGAMTIVMHYHSERLSTSRRTVRLLDMLGGNATVHIALCSGMAERMRVAVPAISSRVRVVGNGWLADDVDPTREAESPTLRLGFLGRFEPDKGWDRALAVFSVLRGLRSVTLEVAGIPLDPLHGEEVRRQVQGAGATYVGPVFGAEKSAFLERVDVLLLPSTYRNETYPVAIVEALAHGCLVAAIDIGCVPEMVGEAGVVACADDFNEKAVGFLGRVQPGANIARSAIDQAAMLRRDGEGELFELLQDLDLTAT